MRGKHRKDADFKGEQEGICAQHYDNFGHKMRPLDSTLKWNCMCLALIYSANRK